MLVRVDNYLYIARKDVHIFKLSLSRLLRELLMIMPLALRRWRKSFPITFGWGGGPACLADRTDRDSPCQQKKTLLLPRQPCSHGRRTRFGECLSWHSRSNPNQQTGLLQHQKGVITTLAGEEGFEPPNASTKNWCLTTWPLPIVALFYPKVGSNY